MKSSIASQVGVNVSQINDFEITVNDRRLSSEEGGPSEGSSPSYTANNSENAEEPIIFGTTLNGLLESFDDQIHGPIELLPSQRRLADTSYSVSFTVYDPEADVENKLSNASFAETLSSNLGTAAVVIVDDTYVYTKNPSSMPSPLPSSQPSSLPTRLCLPGTWKDTDSNTCHACSAGTYSSVEGAESCHSCSPGTFSTEGSAYCTSCGRGKVAPQNGTANACSECPPGEYMDERGEASCKVCPSGSFASENGTHECSRCAAGTYARGNRSITCGDCEDGAFSLPGASSCTNCSENCDPENTDTCAKGFVLQKHGVFDTALTWYGDEKKFEGNVFFPGACFCKGLSQSSKFAGRPFDIDDVTRITPSSNQTMNEYVHYWSYSGGVWTKTLADFSKGFVEFGSGGYYKLRYQSSDELYGCSEYQDIMMSEIIGVILIVLIAIFSVLVFILPFTEILSKRLNSSMIKPIVFSYQYAYAKVQLRNQIKRLEAMEKSERNYNSSELKPTWRKNCIVKLAEIFAALNFTRNTAHPFWNRFSALIYVKTRVAAGCSWIVRYACYFIGYAAVDSIGFAVVCCFSAFRYVLRTVVTAFTSVIGHLVATIKEASEMASKRSQAKERKDYTNAAASSIPVSIIFECWEEKFTSDACSPLLKNALFVYQNARELLKESSPCALTRALAHLFEEREREFRSRLESNTRGDEDLLGEAAARCVIAGLALLNQIVSSEEELSHNSISPSSGDKEDLRIVLHMWDRCIPWGWVPEDISLDAFQVSEARKKIIASFDEAAPETEHIPAKSLPEAKKGALATSNNNNDDLRSQLMLATTNSDDLARNDSSLVPRDDFNQDIQRPLSLSAREQDAMMEIKSPDLIVFNAQPGYGDEDDYSADFSEEEVRHGEDMSLVLDIIPLCIKSIAKLVPLLVVMLGADIMKLAGNVLLVTTSFRVILVEVGVWDIDNYHEVMDTFRSALGELLVPIYPYFAYAAKVSWDEAVYLLDSINITVMEWLVRLYDITCEGPKAPGYVLTNMLVLVIFVLLYQSKLLYLVNMTARSFVVFYDGNTISKLASITFVVSMTTFFRFGIQVLATLVNFLVFFRPTESHGHSFNLHPFDVDCNNAIGISEIPMINYSVGGFERFNALAASLLQLILIPLMLSVLFNSVIPGVPEGTEFPEVLEVELWATLQLFHSWKMREAELKLRHQQDQTHSRLGLMESETLVIEEMSEEIIELSRCIRSMNEQKMMALISTREAKDDLERTRTRSDGMNALMLTQEIQYNTRVRETLDVNINEAQETLDEMEISLRRARRELLLRYGVLTLGGQIEEDNFHDISHENQHLPKFPNLGPASIIVSPSRLSRQMRALKAASKQGSISDGVMEHAARDIFLAEEDLSLVSLSGGQERYTLERFMDDESMLDYEEEERETRIMDDAIPDDSSQLGALQELGIEYNDDTEYKDDEIVGDLTVDYKDDDRMIYGGDDDYESKDDSIMHNYDDDGMDGIDEDDGILDPSDLLIEDTFPDYEGIDEYDDEITKSTLPLDDSLDDEFDYTIRIKEHTSLPSPALVFAMIRRYPEEVIWILSTYFGCLWYKFKQLLKLTVGWWDLELIRAMKIREFAAEYDETPLSDNAQELAMIGATSFSHSLIWQLFPGGIVLSKFAEAINACPLYVDANVINGVPPLLPGWIIRSPTLRKMLFWLPSGLFNAIFTFDERKYDMATNRIVPCIMSLTQYFTILALAYKPHIKWLYIYAAMSFMRNSFYSLGGFTEIHGIDLTWIGMLRSWVFLRLSSFNFIVDWCSYLTIWILDKCRPRPVEERSQGEVDGDGERSEESYE